MKKKFLRLVIACSFSVISLAAASAARADIIESVTENMNETGSDVAMAKGGSACNHLQNVTTFMDNNAYPVRSGKYAFQHVVGQCGERSEFRTKKTEIGKTYWYGWSAFIPTDWKDTDAGHDMLNQWPTYPTNNKNFSKACGANGSFLARGRGGSGEQIDFFLQHAGDTATIECEKFPLAKVSQVRGKWVDFVMNVKWTGNQDGFLKLWMKTGNDSYTQKVDYKGRTFWNDEGTGPYFKMGLYKGDPNFKGPAPRTVYTDEYRLGDERASFEEVAPGGTDGQIVTR